MIRDRERTFLAGDTVNIRYQLKNIGHWYGKPAAKNINLYINFEESFDPIELRYGSTLEMTNTKVSRGKSNSKYMKAEGIHLTYYEEGEEVEVKVRLPLVKGKFKSWIAAFSDEGDCGVHKFIIRVTEEIAKEPNG